MKTRDTFNRFIYYSINISLSTLVNKPIILYFHRIKEPTNTIIDRRIGVIRTDQFRETIKYILKLGYHIITLEELVKRIHEHRLSKLAVITFDDGFIDLYRNAYPILKELKIPFTLFLTSSSVDSLKLLWQHKLYILLDKLSLNQMNEVFESIDFILETNNIDKCLGNLFMSMNKQAIEELVSKVQEEADFTSEEERNFAKELYLSKDNLVEMSENGLSIEVHGFEHWPLIHLNKKETEDEVITAQKYLLNEFRTKPKFYAIPFGIRNKYIDYILNSLGINCIFSSGMRVVTYKDYPFNIPRIGKLNDFTSIDTVLYRAYKNYIIAKLKKVLRRLSVT